MLQEKSKVFVPVSIQTRMIKDNDENNKTHIKKRENSYSKKKLKRKKKKNYKCPFFLVGYNLIQGIVYVCVQVFLSPNKGLQFGAENIK